MLANWVISRHCEPDEHLGEKLAVAPFDCIVIVLSSAVADSDAVSCFFRELAEGGFRGTCFSSTESVLREKHVVRVSDTVYVALHRAKVRNCTYTPWAIRSRGLVEAFSFNLCMDTTRQRMSSINIGIVDIRGVVTDFDQNALVEWIVLDRIAVLTGFFGTAQPQFFENIAVRAKAVSFTPLHQLLQVYDDRSRGQVYMTHPSYFLLFGKYRSISIPRCSLILPDDWQLGQDIWHELVRHTFVPSWGANTFGSPLVTELGNVKMKEADLKRWLPHVFQTCLWLGTSTPSKSSQEKTREWQEVCRSRGQSSKAKGRGKGKGKP